MPDGHNDIPCKIKERGGDHKARQYMPQSPEAAGTGEQAQTSDKRMLKAAFGIVPESPDAKDDEISNCSSGLKHRLDDLEGNVEEVQTSRSWLACRAPRPNSNHLLAFNDLDGTLQDVVTSQSSLAGTPPRLNSKDVLPFENFDDTFEDAVTSQSSLARCPPMPSSTILSPLEDPPSPSMEDLPKLHVEHDAMGEASATSSYTQDRLWQSATDTRAEERDEVLINIEALEEYSRHITDSPVEW